MSATNWVEIIGFAQETITGNVGILNASDTRINPSREETLLAILAALGGSAGLKFYQYGEQLNIAPATPTIVNTYTVPVGKKLILALIQAASDNRATFEVLIDSVLVAKRYTQVTILTTDFSFGSGLLVGVEVSAGQTVDVSVNQNGPSNADMNATIFGELEDA